MTALIRINCDQPMSAGTCGTYTHAPGTDITQAEQDIARSGWTMYGAGQHRCPGHSPWRNYGPRTPILPMHGA